MSDQEKESQTRASDEPTVREAGLSDLLRVGSDRNAMLLGPTPLEGGEETGADRAASGAATEASAHAEDGVEPATPEDDQAQSGKAGSEKARAGKSASSAGQAAGVAITLLGVLLLVVPLISAPLSQRLERVIDPRVYAGVLIVGGLLLSTFSVLRRTLRIIQGSLDDVGSETARLDRIATDSRAVLDALHTVRLENTTLTEDMVKLQGKLKRLTEIVSSPDYAGSMFRLAASVDLLGKHVEVYMKEQFGSIQQRLTTITQQAEQAEQQLKSALGQVHGLTKEQLRVQQLAAQQGFDHLHAATDKTAARIEQGLQVTARIDANIRSQQEALAKGWASLSDRLSLSVSQVANDLNELRAGIARQAESQSASLHAEFEQLDDRIGLAERNQTSGIKQLSEQVQGQQETLSDGWTGLSDRLALSVSQVASDLNELRAGIARQAESQSASLHAEIEHLDDRIGAAERNQVSGIKQLSEQVQGQLASRVEDLQQSLKLLLDLTSRGHQGAAEGFDELGTRFDKHSREQQASLQQVRERATEATRAAKGELAAILDQLRAHLEQLARDHTAALRQSSQEVQQSAGAAQSEFAANLEQIGSRLEQALEARTRNLASDMMEVSEMVRSITAEVRSCIAESILRAVSAGAESAASRGREAEWPRLDVGNPEPESAEAQPGEETAETVSTEATAAVPPERAITAEPASWADGISDGAEPTAENGSSPPPEVRDP